MRVWTTMFIIIALVLFTAVGCVNVPRQGQEVTEPSAPIAYLTQGHAPFVSIFVQQIASGFLVPVSVYRKVGDPPPIQQAVALLNGELGSTEYRLLGGAPAKIQSVALHNGVLDIEMPPEFPSWVLRNQTEERAFIGAVILTFTAFDDVEAVRFMVLGRPIQGMVGGLNLSGRLVRPTFVNYPKVAPSHKIALPHAVVYARVKGSNVLVPVTRSLPRRDPAAALQALLEFAPADNLISPLPQGIRLRAVTVEGGVAIVDLDRRVVNLFLQGAFNEQIVVDALVHTLLEFPEIRQVQFLIDGRVLGPVSANVDLSRPLSRTPINVIAP